MNQKYNNINLNSLGSNGVPNNSSLDSNQIVGYNPQTGQPIYQTQQIETIKPKKKLKWWIPLLLFIGGILMLLGNFVVTIIVNSQNDLVLESDLIKNPIRLMFSWLAFICWLMVIPSLIIVIVKYFKKTPDEEVQTNFIIDNMISNASSLDEKLLIAYIGNNYQKILDKKFSVPALFFSWIYTLYRKVYIPSIIGMVAITIFKFLPNSIYNIIIFSFLIVLAFNFNKWYIIYAKKQINNIKVNNQNTSENELINICKKKGGTNIWLAIVIWIIFAIVSGL